MAETLSRRERKKLETRQALLMAALSLFRAKGYDATAVEEITAQADVAKGTFFNYFPSKEALLGELDLWSVEQLRAALDVSQGAPASPVARLKLLMRLMHEQARRDMELIHRAFVARLCAPQPLPPEGKRQLFGLLAELVGEAQACGEIRADVPAELVSDLLRISFSRQMGPFHAAHHGLPPVPHVPGGPVPHVPGGPVPHVLGGPGENVEQIVDLLLEGLAGPAWRPGVDPQPEHLEP